MWCTFYTVKWLNQEYLIWSAVHFLSRIWRSEDFHVESYHMRNNKHAVKMLRPSYTYEKRKSLLCMLVCINWHHHCLHFVIFRRRKKKMPNHQLAFPVCILLINTKGSHHWISLRLQKNLKTYLWFTGKFWSAKMLFSMISKCIDGYLFMEYHTYFANHDALWNWNLKICVHIWLSYASAKEEAAYAEIRVFISFTSHCCSCCWHEQRLNYN